MTQTSQTAELQVFRVFASVVDWVLSDSQVQQQIIPGSATDVPIQKVAQGMSTVLRIMYS